MFPSPENQIILGNDPKYGENPGLPGNNPYCMIAMDRNKLKVNRSTYEILQILSISLLDIAPKWTA